MHKSGVLMLAFAQGKRKAESSLKNPIGIREIFDEHLSGTHFANLGVYYPLRPLREVKRLCARQNRREA